MKSTITRYFMCYVILVLVGLLIVAIINYRLDPAHLFSAGEYEAGIADLLISGKNIANISNCDERLLQKYYVSNLHEGKDVIILGSSRSMQIGSDTFPRMSFFNNGVPGASLEDYLAIYELYDQRNFIPSIVVLGMDPWILNENNGQDRWLSLEQEYLTIAKRLSIPSSLLDLPSSTNKSRLTELISFAYFKQSVIKLFFQQRGRYYPTTDKIWETGGVIADGSRLYNSQSRNKSPAEVTASAVSYAKENPVYSLGSFKNLDKGSLTILTKFIDYLRWTPSLGQDRGNVKVGSRYPQRVWC